MTDTKHWTTNKKEYVMRDLSEYQASDEKWSRLYRTLPELPLEHFDDEAESGNQNYLLHNKKTHITTIVVKKRGALKND